MIGNSSHEAGDVDFDAAVRHASFTCRHVVVFTMLGLLILFDGMDTQLIGLVAHDLTQRVDRPLADFGVVFSIGLFGGVVGALVLSPLADRRLGRKAMVIGAMGIAGISTILTAWATNLTELVAIRFVAGFCLGGALPAIFPLAAEFAPSRYSRLITSGLVAFAPLGSLLGGLIGRAVIPAFGWQMLLYVGGGLTMALAALAAWQLPESVSFLLRAKRDPARAMAHARMLLPDLPAGRLIACAEPQEKRARQPITRLFTGGLWRFTALIWIAFVLNQAILFFVLSWTPALLQRSGVTHSIGMDSAAMFGLGGALGTLSQGWFTTRYNIFKVMFVQIAIYISAIALLPLVISHELLAPLMVFFIAAGICAYHSGFVILLMETYPEDVRATAFGWAFGLGRVGATSAPAIAGALVALGWSTSHIFIAATLPGAVSAIALIGIALLLRRKRGSGGSERDESVSSFEAPATQSTAGRPGEVSWTH